MKKFFQDILSYFSDEENPEEPHYDPLHAGATMVLTIFGISALFWLLWSLLVFGGGIQAKVLPFLQILFTKKTAADFGYAGYPYEMGVFAGWITNVVALVFLFGFIYAVWYIFEHSPSEKKH